MTISLLTILFTTALGASLLSGVVAILAGRASWGNAVAQSIAALGGLAGTLGIGAYVVMGGYQSAIPVLPLAFGFVVTPLSAFFLSIIYLGTFLTSIYSMAILPRYTHVYSLPWLNLASGFFILGMQATVLSSSVFSFLTFWEIMSVSAYFLVIADRSEDSLSAGLLYFVMTHLGFASLMAGFFVLSGGNPFATWSDVAEAASQLSPAMLGVSFFLLLIGFGSKAGLVPLHQWLPYAHPQAPSGSSALLSGVMLKVALFGFIQAIFLFPMVSIWWAGAVVCIGLLSAVFGVLHAAVDEDAKKVLAWSSVENMGLIFSALGVFLMLRTIGTPGLESLAGGAVLFIMAHSINHFLFKSGLFMAVGAVVSETHTRDLDDMGGLAQKWPSFSAVFLCLALAAAALPPFGTFFGEWAYVQSLAGLPAILPPVHSIVAGLVLSCIALVGGLAIFAFVRLFGSMFLGQARTEHVAHVKPIPMLALFPLVISVVLLVLSGLFAFPLLGSIVQVTSVAGYPMLADSPMNPWSVGVLVAVLLVVLVILARIVRAHVRVTDTWDCGQPITPRMEYTASGYAAPIRFFFRSLVIGHKELVVEPVSAGNKWIASRRLDWGTLSLWEEWLYDPLTGHVSKFSSFVKRLQSGIVQTYLALMILALIAVLIYAI